MAALPFETPGNNAISKKKVSHSVKTTTGREAFYFCETHTRKRAPMEATDSQPVTRRDADLGAKQTLKKGKVREDKTMGCWSHH